MTPEEVREARAYSARCARADTAVVTFDKTVLLARYARELERHAEAMANSESMVELIEARIAYRTQFPRSDEDGRNG
jgi:hypothetical protein